MKRIDVQEKYHHILVLSFKREKLKQKRDYSSLQRQKFIQTQLSKSKSDGIEIASMDDKRLFGDVLFKLSFSNAIKESLLSDYQVVVIGIDDQ